ncbi:MAG TPA: hypothetical protein VK788_09105 [Terriglobales bacterium]|jgi:hypothetical protein|nr:hypothetical protein [Terriglobales bacterium]
MRPDIQPHCPGSGQVTPPAHRIGPDISRRELLGNCMKTLALAMMPFDPQSSEPGLSEARRFLRKAQASAAKDAPGFPYKSLENVTEQSLILLKVQRRLDPTSDVNTVRRGVSHFHREDEEERIRHSEELVRRVQPGPFEDPGYFAFLAYEAASIEMALPKLGKERFSQYLLGTIHEASVNAFSKQFDSTGYTVVLLYSGLIDFIYQCAKAVVEALHPVRTPESGSHDRRSLVQATMDLEKIRAELKANDAPVNRVYRTLESYFFKGYPRAFANETLLAEHVPMLEVLVSMAERWTLAHEYGHGLASGLDFSKAPGKSSWSEEFVADNSAAILTVSSAASLDDVRPEFALSGGNFSLACLDIIRRAYSIVTTGCEGQDSGSKTHPPYKLRAERNIAVFRQFFDYRDNGDAGFDLDFVLREETPAEHGFGSEYEGRVYAFSNVLFDIWPAVKERLGQQFTARRPLHKIWR